MADGSVPIAVSPVPFHSRETRAMAVASGSTVRAALLQAVVDGVLPEDDLRRVLPRTRVMVNGEVLDRENALDRRLKPSDIVNIEVCELGGGGGGDKDIGQIILTIAVIAVAAWVGGPAGAGLGIKSAMLRAVASAAVMTLGQAAIAALYAPETNAVKTNDRYALQSASNQYRPWASFPLALGEVHVAPDFVVKTFTQNIGEDVWIHGILGLHYGACEVDQEKIGDTLISSMGAGDVRIQHHLTPGPRTFSIYPNDVDQLDLQEELNVNQAWVTRAGSSEGERFEFDFFFPAGLHFQKDDGRVLSTSVTLTVEKRPIDANGDPTGPGTWSPALSAPMVSTTKDPMRITRSVTLPMGRYEFRIKRSAQADANPKRKDQVALTAIRSVAFRKPVTDETLSLIEFAVRATALNQGSLAPITCRIKPKAQTWTGAEWGPAVATSNPAAWARWLVTGPAAAQPLESEEADVRLRFWFDVCQSYGWFCHLYLNGEERTQADALTALAEIGRAGVCWDGRQLAGIPWVEKPSPRQLFAGDNLKDHRWTIVYPDEVHALRMEFQNLDEAGEPDEVYVYADGYGETASEGVLAAVLVEGVRLEGQWLASDAWKRGRWLLGQRLHQRRVDTWTAPAEWLVSGYGDRVRLAWSKLDGGEACQVRTRRWSGAMVSGLRLTQPVTMHPGESYALDLRLVDGVETAVAVLNPATSGPVVTREVMFAVARAAVDSPKAGQKVAFGTPLRISEDVELVGIEPGEGLTASLTGIRYVAPLLLAGETGDIPELQTRLTRQRMANPPTPRLLGVQADPAGVRISFDMPPWSGSPVVGFSVRWRQTPGLDQDTAWTLLPALDGRAQGVLIVATRAVPVDADDDEGRYAIDVEIRAITAAGQTSPEPLTLTDQVVRDDPFAPTGLLITPATRTAPGGSSHGVLIVSVDALAAAVGVDLILEVQRTPLTGSPDPWEAAGLTLAARNPIGDIYGLRSGERYRIRAGWRTGAGWPSIWTTSGLVTVPAGSNVSDDTAAVFGVGSPALVGRLVSAEAQAASADAKADDILAGFPSITDAVDAAEAARDVAVVKAGEASGDASASAGSASTALVARGGAEAAAVAATGQAAIATTKAGDASAAALISVSAKDDAIEARDESTTQASTAVGAAATATGQASIASAKALEASNSAIVAVGAGQGFLNKNPYFAAWTNPSLVPDNWAFWWVGQQALRDTVASGGAMPYVMRWPATGSTEGGIRAFDVSGLKKGLYVVSMEVTLTAGDLAGVGFLFRPQNSSGVVFTYEHEQQIRYLQNADGSGLVGLGTPGRTYRVDYFADCRSDAGTYDDMNAVQFWVMVNGYFSGGTSNKDVSIRMAGYRLATAEEARSRQVLAPLGASVSQQATAMLDLTNQNALARWQVTGTGPSGQAILGLLSDAYGTSVYMGGDRIWFGPDTFFDTATLTLRTLRGARFTVTALGPPFGIDGMLTYWSGPSSVSFAATSKLNGYRWSSEDAPYEGGNALPSGAVTGGAVMKLSNTAGNITNNAVTQTWGSGAFTDLPTGGFFRVQVGINGLALTTSGSSFVNGDWEIVVGSSVIASGSWEASPGDFQFHPGAEVPVRPIADPRGARGNTTVAFRVRRTSGGNVTNSGDVYVQIDWTAGS